MTYPLNPPLMELLVLSLILREDSYGYQISQQMKRVSQMKDSTLYPVLRRLSEQQCVNAYDQPYQGRNRKYYQITEKGKAYQEQLEQEWNTYTAAVREILERSRDAAEGGKEEKNE